VGGLRKAQERNTQLAKKGEKIEEVQVKRLAVGVAIVTD
jgi:hypothetical protein